MSINLPNPLFSIIVPVYNASEYLNRIMDALLAQKFQEMEVIFVDDKSTDNSLVLLREFEIKNDFVKVHGLAKNEGIGYARNFGINKATGKYLFFHDADDWLEANGLIKLKKHIKEKEYPDLILFPHSVYDNKLNLIKSNKRKMDNLPTGLNGLIAYQAVCSGSISSSLWNKAFKKSTWEREGLSFDNRLYIEDFPLIPYACLKMETISYLNSPLYCYFLNDDGITKKISDRLISASYQGLMSLGLRLMEEENYLSLKEGFIRFAFKTFRHNFFYSDRNSRFTDEQVIEYAELFQVFCKEHSIRFNHILNNDKALQLVRGFLLERKIRRITAADHLTISLSGIEEFLDHYAVIVDQFQKSSSTSGDANLRQKEWAQKVKKLKEQNKRKRQEIKQLKKNIRSITVLDVIKRNISLMLKGSKSN